MWTFVAADSCLMFSFDVGSDVGLLIARRLRAASEALARLVGGRFFASALVSTAAGEFGVVFSAENFASGRLRALESFLRFDEESNCS